MNFFFIDLETTGLPKTKGYNNYYSYTDYNKYDSCRVVEIAWIVLSPSHEKLLEKQYIVKSNDFVIPTSEIHTITEEKSKQEGILLVDILKELFNDIKTSGTFLSYNILFDLNILQSEISRLNKITEMNDLLLYIESMKKQCVMIMCCNYLDVNSIKLINAYKKIIKKELINSHQALPDTRAVCELFMKIRIEQMYNKGF